MPQIHVHIWVVLSFGNSSKANFVENCNEKCSVNLQIFIFQKLQKNLLGCDPPQPILPSGPPWRDSLGKKNDALDDLFSEIMKHSMKKSV